MDQVLMRTMLDVDEHHWWYRGRRRIIGAELAQLPLPARACVLDSGWRLCRMTSFNTLLLAPAAAVRLAQRGLPRSQYRPEIRLGPPWLNSVLERPLRWEARWLAAGRTLPLGLSLMAVLQNPPQ